LTIVSIVISFNMSYYLLLCGRGPYEKLFGQKYAEKSVFCFLICANSLFPWSGDPRVNIQNDKGMAKIYQVRQVLKAIERLEAQENVKE